MQSLFHKKKKNILTRCRTTCICKNILTICRTPCIRARYSRSGSSCSNNGSSESESGSGPVESDACHFACFFVRFLVSESELLPLACHSSSSSFACYNNNSLIFVHAFINVRIRSLYSNIHDSRMNCHIKIYT